MSHGPWQATKHQGDTHKSWIHWKAQIESCLGIFRARHFLCCYNSRTVVLKATVVQPPLEGLPTCSYSLNLKVAPKQSESQQTAPEVGPTIWVECINPVHSHHTHNHLQVFDTLAAHLCITGYPKTSRARFLDSDADWHYVLSWKHGETSSILTTGLGCAGYCFHLRGGQGRPCFSCLSGQQH